MHKNLDFLGRFFFPLPVTTFPRWPDSISDQQRRPTQWTPLGWWLPMEILSRNSRRRGLLRWLISTLLCYWLMTSMENEVRGWVGRRNGWESIMSAVLYTIFFINWKKKRNGWQRKKMTCKVTIFRAGFSSGQRPFTRRWRNSTHTHTHAQTKEEGSRRICRWLDNILKGCHSISPSLADR